MELWYELVIVRGGYVVDLINDRDEIVYTTKRIFASEQEAKEYGEDRVRGSYRSDPYGSQDDENVDV